MSTRTNLFQIGGAIPVGRLYIERKADAEVVETLAEGEFCYVLAPRQIGKSSLRLRAAKKLEQQGIRCVSIDFSGIGSGSVTIDEWYFSIAYEIADGLGLSNPELFWTQHEHLTPVHRWYRFIREELLDSSDEPVVVFIDEVDSVLALSFTTDDFFASIRSAYNLRAEDPAYRRLSFCLLGVAAPTDLIQNPVRTPFNIGHAIRLADFTRSEIDAFAPGLKDLGCDTEALLSAVYQWTSGHPYMTQRILQEVARQGSLRGKSESEAIDDAAYQIFLRSGKSSDPTLAYVEKRLDMCDSRVRMRQMLHIYRKLIGGEEVLAEPNSPIQAELRLMGIAADQDLGAHTLLRPRNLIFAEVYDLVWLKSKEKEHGLAESVERWLTSGKLDDWLIRGAALENSLRWARGRADLTNSEHEFLLACVSLARSEAEDRHRTAETMRKDVQAQASLAEQRRRIEEQRFAADIERERAQRAEESAASQRRVITILTVMVAALGAMLAVGVWQYLVAQATKDQLAETTRRANREAKESLLLERAAQALLLTQKSGREVDALVIAVETASQSLLSGRKPPARVRQALAAAVASAPRKPQVLRHDDFLYDAHFSHDGTRVITASRDRTARIWDAVSGKTIATLDEHGDAVRWAVFSADDSRILTASADRNARLWNASSGALLQTFATGDTNLHRASFSADGKRVLTVSVTRPPRLWSAISGEFIATFKGHRRSTEAVFSASGRRILTASSDGKANIWDGRTGKLIVTLNSHGQAIMHAGIADDERRIITTGDDFTPRLWRIDGSPVTSLKGHRDVIAGARFSPDSTRVLTYDESGLAILWNSHDGRETVRLRGHSKQITHGVFSADSSLVATTSADGTARLWKVDSGEEISVLTGHTGVVRGAVFGPLGGRLATFGEDKTIRLWSTTRGDLLGLLEGHTAAITGVEFAPNGYDLLSTSSEDNSARLWDTSLNNRIPTLKGHRLPISKAAFNGDGSRIVTASDDRSARLWGTQDNELIQILDGHLGPVTDAVFAPTASDRLVTIAEDDPVALLWRAGDGQAVAQLQGHIAPVLAVAFSADGSQIVTTGADDTTRRWRASDGTALDERTCTGTAGALRRATLANDGVHLVGVSRDGVLNQLWNTDACQFIDDLSGHASPVTRIAFSADGQMVATASADRTTRIWSTRYGTSMATIENDHGAVQALAFSPDGSRLVSANLRDAWVWSTATGNQLGTLTGHSSAVLDSVFSADGTMIATASGDNTARVWAATPGGYELIATLAGHSAAVDHARFSADGRYVVTGARDNTAKIYPTTLPDYLDRACELLSGHRDAFQQVRLLCSATAPTRSN